MVKHAALDQHTPYQERFSIALLLPRHLFIWQAVLIGSFGIAIIGVIGLMHYASPPRNPFATYADVFPGQPIRALNAHGFICTMQPRESSEMHCVLAPDTGDFSNVVVVYSSDLIQVVNFDLRDSTLNVGDLTGMLGPPVIRFDGSVSFNWRGNVGIARIRNPPKYFSLFGRVGQVMLTSRRWDGS